MTEDKRPVRKQIRMPEYDYDSNGAYFITVCTRDRKPILSKVSVGTTIGRPPNVILTKYGRIVEEAIQQIHAIYPSRKPFCSFSETNVIKARKTLSVSRVIQQLKGAVTKRIGHPIWQSRFYDHVIRTERDYRDIYTYIDNNPAHWAEDEYY